MAPEVLALEPNSPRPNYMLCDLYSFGVVLFEMLTGKKPWSKLENHIILKQVVDKDLRPDSQASHLPDGVLATLMRECWQKDCHQRGSFAEVEQRLGPEAAGELHLPRVLTIAPLETPDVDESGESYDVLHDVVIEVHKIGQCYKNSDVATHWDDRDIRDKMSKDPPKVLIFCCHRGKDRLLLGKITLMNAELCEFFRSRQECQEHEEPNPECVLLSACGGGNLHEELLEVGIKFVIYWERKTLDRVAAQYTKEFLEMLKDSTSLKSPQRYRRAHDAAKQQLQQKLEDSFLGESSESKREELREDLRSLARLKCCSSSKSLVSGEEQGVGAGPSRVSKTNID